MLLTTHRLAHKHIGFTVVSLLVIACILTASLLRNAPAISFWQMFFGLAAIAISLCWGVLQRQAGYWLYSVTAARTLEFLRPESANNLPVIRSRWRQVLSRPACAMLITALLVMLLCWVVDSILPDYRYWAVWLIGGLLIPLWLGLLLKLTIFYYVEQAVKERLLYAQQALVTAKRYSLHYYLLTDLLFSLLINFALVLPIADKPAFSLQQGYLTPTFTIAFAILLVVVLSFMLCFAHKQDRYMFCGELLRGAITDNFGRGTALWQPKPRLSRWRYLAYLLFILFWSGILAQWFAHFVVSAHFVMLYLLGLAPIIVIYYVERRGTLIRCFQQAYDMYQRMDWALHQMSKPL